MNPEHAEAADLPLYAVVDRRYNGRPRIVAEYRDPEAANHAAQSLIAAGSDAHVELVTAIETFA